jgi:hypothetical protein
VRIVATIAGAVTALALAAPAAAQQDAAALANATANPVADLAVVPFQFNWNDGFGTEDAGQMLLNIQPVVPFVLNDRWNLITRTIIPIVNDDGPFFPGADEVSGVGDVFQSFFFSPREPGPGGLIWGAGPVILWPTATEERLGGDTFGLGLTGVALQQTGRWTYGGLANHVWSIDADPDGEISASFVQPFVNYTLPSATSFYLNTESTYDWNDNQWSVPINAGVRQIVPLGGQVVQIGAGVRYWAQSPENGPEDWGFRLDFNLLFPRG